MWLFVCRMSNVQCIGRNCVCINKMLTDERHQVEKHEQWTMCRVNRISKEEKKAKLKCIEYSIPWRNKRWEMPSNHIMSVMLNIWWLKAAKTVIQFSNSFGNIPAVAVSSAVVVYIQIFRFIFWLTNFIHWSEFIVTSHRLSHYSVQFGSLAIATVSMFHFLVDCIVYKYMKNVKWKTHPFQGNSFCPEDIAELSSVSCMTNCFCGPNRGRIYV